jgi:hypothetical protein
MVELRLDVSRVAGCQDGRLLWRACGLNICILLSDHCLKSWRRAVSTPNISAMASQRAAS